MTYGIIGIWKEKIITQTKFVRDAVMCILAIRLANDARRVERKLRLNGKKIGYKTKSIKSVEQNLLKLGILLIKIKNTSITKTGLKKTVIRWLSIRNNGLKETQINIGKKTEEETYPNLVLLRKIMQSYLTARVMFVLYVEKLVRLVGDWRLTITTKLAKLEGYSVIIVTKGLVSSRIVKSSLCKRMNTLNDLIAKGLLGA
jgi:hypothetical protein